MSKAFRVFVLAAQLTAVAILLGADPEIEFLESPHGAGTQMECKRNGVVIYKHIEMPTPKSRTSLWIFYWDGKRAVTVLTVGNEPAVQQYSGLPVSFTVHLTSAGQPSFVSIERPDGTVIDGLLCKSNGRLTPVPTAELPTSPTPIVK
jgi:hypothetical protein